jgi:hypothetical protein
MHNISKKYEGSPPSSDCVVKLINLDVIMSCPTDSVTDLVMLFREFCNFLCNSATLAIDITVLLLHIYRNGNISDVLDL